MTERSRRRSRSSAGAATRRGVAVLGCIAAVAAAIVMLPARAAARTMTVTPNVELTDGQYVDVAWTGFEPSTDEQTRPVRVRLCPAAATKVSDCAKSSPTFREPGDARVGYSGPDGSGSIPFVIKAGDIVPISGADPFFCDKNEPCKLIAFQLNGSSIETSFTDSVAVDLAYAQSTVPCPLGGEAIAGSGGSTARGALVQWQSEVCQPPTSLNVSYVYTNSVQGADGFAKGLSDSDFAVTGMPLTQEQLTTLDGRGVQPAYVPISAGSLVLVYNLWFDRDGDGVSDQMKDLQLSAATVADIYEGRISSWNDPKITADNPGVKMPVKQVKAVARADNSAATWWLTSWLNSVAPDAYKAGGTDFQKGPTTTFPAGRGMILVTGTDKVAQYVRTFPGEQSTDNTDVPFAGFIGYVYFSEAQKLGLPVVALKNAAGQYVRPMPDNVAKGFAGGSLSDLGVFTPDFSSTDPGAYPIPVASYLVGPTGDSEDVDAQKADTLGRFLTYVTGPGQQAATTRGYVPLPTTLKTTADANIAKIAAKPVEQLQPSPTAATAPPTAAPLQQLVPAATLGTTVDAASSVAEEPATTQPSTSTVVAPSASVAAPAYANTSSSTPDDRAADDVPAPVQKAAETVKRVVDGVIGIGSIASTPLGLPVLALAAVCALFLGRLLLRMDRPSTPGVGPTSRSAMGVLSDLASTVMKRR